MNFWIFVTHSLNPKDSSISLMFALILHRTCADVVDIHLNCFPKLTLTDKVRLLLTERLSDLRASPACGFVMVCGLHPNSRRILIRVGCNGRRRRVVNLSTLVRTADSSVFSALLCLARGLIFGFNRFKFGPDNFFPALSENA